MGIKQRKRGRKKMLEEKKRQTTVYIQRERKKDK